MGGGSEGGRQVGWEGEVRGIGRWGRRGSEGGRQVGGSGSEGDRQVGWEGE